jgi:hypothetical protein
MAAATPTPVTPTSREATAPYPVNSLKAPLTLAQRTKVISFIVSNGESLFDIFNYVGLGLGALFPGAITDAQGTSLLNKGNYDTKLIAMYNSIVQGGNFIYSGDPNDTVHTPYTGPGSSLVHGTEDIGTFLGQLSNPELWTRVAEGAIGIILLAIGFHAIVTSSPSFKSTSSQKSSAIKLTKAIK